MTVKAVVPALDNKTAAPSRTEVMRLILLSCDVKESSRQTYKYGVSRFLDFCATTHWSRYILQDYKRHLQSLSTISSNTKALYLNAARISCRYFYLTGLAEEDVSRSVKSFKVSRLHKRAPISEFDRRKIFRWLAQQGDTRLSLVFHLLAFQGLRRFEVCSIAVEDFHPANKTLLINSKGVDGKVLIHLHPKTVKALQGHIQKSRLSSGFVFPSSSKSGHMTTVTLHRLVQQVHRACRIKATVHGWRKYFTSSLLENGFDVITASRFTRHRNVNTLQVYYDRVDIMKNLPAFESTFRAD